VTHLEGQPSLISMYLAQEMYIPVHISILNSVVSKSASLLASALSCFTARCFRAPAV